MISRLTDGKEGTTCYLIEGKGVLLARAIFSEKGGGVDVRYDRGSLGLST